MATIKYFLRGRKDLKSITAKLSLAQKTQFERKTGLSIHKDEWSKEKGLPKQTKPENKILSSKLRKLSANIIDALNESQAEGEKISADWLTHQIDVHFKRIAPSGQSELVIDSIDNLLADADVRKNQKGGNGLSKSRKNDYDALKRIWGEFEGSNSIKVKEVNIPLSKKFLSFMLKQKGYGLGYAKRMMGNLKTVCYDAQLADVKTSSQLKKIDAAQVKNDYIIYLTPDELEKIKKAPLAGDGQRNARKWLLLGCWIGQRGNDLLNLTEKNLKERDGFRYLELKQQKTAKTVQIPILPEVDEVLADGFPRKISLVKFNDHIKTIAKNAGLNEKTKGILNNPKTNRKELGEYKKWQLLASHVCRRSYCSNMYGKLPTPIIMQVSGHGSERSFLTYVGKKGTDYKDEWMEFIEKQKKKSTKEPQLEVMQTVNH